MCVAVVYYCMLSSIGSEG